MFGWIKNILALLGFLLLAAVGIIFLLASPWLLDKGEIVIDDVVHAPNNKFKAVSYRDMGGGAAGYCFRRVVILKSSSEMPSVDEKQDYVFASGCGTKVDFSWRNAETIDVTYSSESPDYLQVELYFSAQGGDVTVNFEHDT